MHVSVCLIGVYADVLWQTVRHLDMVTHDRKVQIFLVWGQQGVLQDIENNQGAV
jgi:hypothetical protein